MKRSSEYHPLDEMRALLYASVMQPSNTLALLRAAAALPFRCFKPLFLYLFCCLIAGLSLPAQTTVWLRASGPSAAFISGASGNGTTIQIAAQQTTGPNPGTTGHGFPTGCGTTQLCVATVNGVVNTTGATYADGNRSILYVDSAHLALYDMTGITCGGSTYLGSPLTWSGTYSGGGFGGNPSAASWVGLLSCFTLPAGMNGWFDGVNGNLMHKLVLGPSNGTTTGPNGLANTGSCPGDGVCVTGTAGNQTITITPNPSVWNPNAQTLPLVAGNYLPIFGTGTILDSTTNGCAGVGTPAMPLAYVVSSVSSTSPYTISINGVSCPSALADGDYTNSNPNCGPASSPNGTIGGTQSCTTVSQIMYANVGCASVGGTTTGNPAACWLANLRSQFETDDTADSNWKTILDGSADAGNTEYTTFSQFGVSALCLIVDRSNSTCMRNVDYLYNRPELQFGVSWIIDESQGSGGGGGEVATCYTCYLTVALDFEAGVGYESSSSTNAFLNKVYNDVNNPAYTTSKVGAELSSTNATNGAITFSTATGTTLAAPSCTGLSCTWQLQSGASAVVNQIFWASTSSPLGQNFANNGLITAVIGCAGGSCSVTASMAVAPPASTTAYIIYAGAKWTSGTTTAGTLATYTLYGATNSQLNIAVGDAIEAGNGFPSRPEIYECKVVSATGSASTGTCHNSSNVSSTNLTVSQIVWHFPAMSVSSTGVTGNTGQVGLWWAYKHGNIAGYGNQPVLYPTQGGTSSMFNSSLGVVNWDSNQFGVAASSRIALDFAACPYDARACTDLSQQQSAMWDFTYAHWLSYNASGWAHDGPQYSPFVNEGETMFLWLLNMNAPSMPTLYPSSAWADFPKIYEYSLLPDFYSGATNGYGQAFMWGAVPTGSDMFQNNEGTSNTAGSSMWAPQLWFAPASAGAQYHVNWGENILGSQSPFGKLNLLWAAVAQDEGELWPLFYDPHTTSTSYQNQPMQYEFALNNQSQAASLTGSQYPIDVAGTQALGMFSRTRWNNFGGSGAAGAVLMGRFAAWANGHDCAGPQTGLYEMGMLWDADEGETGSSACDMSVYGSAVNVGGFGSGQWNGGTPTTYPSYLNNQSTVALVAWSSANSGSWPPQYGDQNSNYAHMCADVAGMYLPTLNVTSALECMTDFKQHAGGGTWDHFVIENHEFFTSTPQQLQRTIHYAQNGANASDPSRIPDNAYVTGQTQCINPSGTAVACSTNLNAYRLIEVTEQTAQGYGLISWITSPNTIDVVSACPDTGCNLSNPAQRLGTTFGSGYTSPVMVAAGATLGTSTAEALELVIVNKVMKYTSGAWDTTFRSAALNPGTSWTGADACGTNSGIGYLRYRGKGPSAAVPGFVTGTGATAACASLPYQYLLSGLTPGTYPITVNSTPVSGSPFTVAAGDNSIEFIGAAGTVSINGSVAPPSGKPTSMSGHVAASGNVVIH